MKKRKLETGSIGVIVYQWRKFIVKIKEEKAKIAKKKAKPK
jgi:hypothetical protein